MSGGGMDEGGVIGPDGPWQAIKIYGSPTRVSGEFSINKTHLWPSGSYITNILLASAGGNYAALNATFPYEPLRNSCSPDSETLSAEDSWIGPYDPNFNMSCGVYARDKFYLSSIESLQGSNAINVSLRALQTWKIPFPNGRDYPAQAGILGLGSSFDDSPSILEQAKETGTISSLFCGLHIGSPLLKQRGSMILGGYEQNRVLGDVGMFDVDVESESGGVQAFLLDVVLDVEIGASPFNQSNEISLWHGIDDGAESAGFSEWMGGRTGSRLIGVSASLPYMYLPQGICETAAQYLPLVWDTGLELYIWNATDQSSHIISSPAFMGFVLADKQAKNITIKVPFQLLNLTLQPPIVDAPTQYFPCKPDSSYVLGRAFLQAAFFGFEFENNLSYIAQAPGPNMEQSIIKSYQPNDTTILPNTIGTFASSWASTWRVIEKNTTALANDTAASQSSPGRSVSKGATAGAVIGSALAALAAAVITWRTRRMIRQKASEKTDNADAASLPSIQPASTDRYPMELDHCAEPSEAYGNAPPHEMPSQNRIHEAPDQADRQQFLLE
ncbi:MAG: hypothetical protein Q9190_005260 [Brigantiaea leucoxantha]